jgi:prepilin-type N-terminal cleavage/methylation domain-containing protein
MYNRKNKYYGFTLAEVLITLAIIGVVAALTIPSVVNNYQKQETVTRLKKAFSALANTTNLAIAEHGPIQGWTLYKSDETVPGTSLNGSVYFADNYLVPYLKVQKNCENNTTGDCQFKFLYLNKTGPLNLGTAWSRFILTDGTMIASWPNISENEFQENKTAWVYVDINGKRGPNMVGKDVFQFIYYLDYWDTSIHAIGKFAPRNFHYSRALLTNPETSYACHRGGTGENCATLIMKDGWQIRDDYPW